MIDTGKTLKTGSGFSVGEEVRNAHGTTSIVVGFTEKEEPVLCFASSETKRPSFYVYDEYERVFSPIKKTGTSSSPFPTGRRRKTDYRGLGIQPRSVFFCSKCGLEI